jgi:chromosome segregation ATPase
MPSKELKCEFCDKLFRKNELARHTQAKHKQELSQFVLQEYIDNPEYNSLQRYAKGLNPKCNPVYSKLYNDGCYFFGANPTFFEEEDSYASYIKSDENMKYHNEFLTELVRTISLLDFLQVERKIQVRSEEVKRIEKENRDSEELIKKLKHELDQAKSHNQYLQGVVKDFKEATECSSTIQCMKDEIDSLNKAVNYYRNEADSYQAKINKINDSRDEWEQSLYESANNEKKKVNQQCDELLLQLEKSKNEVKELTTKREAYCNTRLEKEVKKETQKLEKQHQKEIDELEEEITKLEKEIKKLKRAKKSRSSDSDSD